MDTDRSYVVQYSGGGEDPVWSDDASSYIFEFDSQDQASEQRAWVAAKAVLAYMKGLDEDEEFKMLYRIVSRRVVDEVM